MTAISGRNLRELFDVLDPVGCFLRTCRESSVWRVALTGYSLTWVRAATPQGRSLFRLRLSAPTTAATGSGLWPTPKAQEDGRTPEQWEEARLRHYETRKASGTSGGPAGKNGSLSVAVQMWPTPRMEGFDAGSLDGNPDSLHSAVKMLHTPTSKANQLSPSMVERDAGSYGHGMLPTARAQMGSLNQPSADRSHATGGPPKRPEVEATRGMDTAGLKLSAAWVTRLMMYPDGWLDDLPPDPIGKPASPASPATSPTA